MRQLIFVHRTTVSILDLAVYCHPQDFDDVFLRRKNLENVCPFRLWHCLWKWKRMVAVIQCPRTRFVRVHTVANLLFVKPELWATCSMFGLALSTLSIPCTPARHDPVMSHQGTWRLFLQRGAPLHLNIKYKVSSDAVIRTYSTAWGRCIRVQTLNA